MLLVALALLAAPAAPALAQTAPSPSPGSTASASPPPTGSPSYRPTPPPADPPEPTVTVTEADSGRTVTLQAGQVLEVRLGGAHWQGPGSREGIYLVSYLEGDHGTTAQLQALTPSNRPVRLTAHTDSACLHNDPACAQPQRTWTLDVLVNNGQDAGTYRCYSNPTPSPATGTVLITQADNGRRVQVEQGGTVDLRLSGCDDPYTVPTANGPLFRSSADYRANGSNQSVFSTVSVGTATITSQTDLSCFHVPSEYACARPTGFFSVTVDVVPSATPDQCQPATVRFDEDTITATGEAGVTVAAGKATEIDLYAYSRPSTTYRLVRTGAVGPDGTVRFSVRPPTNTRLYTQSRGCGPGPSVVLNVRTALTLTAERLSTATYRFAGDSLPARPGGLVVSLYRVTDDGRQVLTAQARASATDGQWSLVRRFTGTGRFGFLVRTGQDLTNAPGASNVRPTLIF